MVAEIDYDCIEKDEESCQNCLYRFKCWTSRNLQLQINHLTMHRDIYCDEVEFKAELPRCFKCNNMVGNKVTIRLGDNDTQVFNGLIIAHYIHYTEPTTPMVIEIKAFRRRE